VLAARGSEAMLLEMEMEIVSLESTVGIAFHRRLFSMRRAGEPPMDDAVRTPGLKSAMLPGALSCRSWSWPVQIRSVTCASIRPGRHIAHDRREVR
jgi:hypothetical protein